MRDEQVLVVKRVTPMEEKTVLSSTNLASIEFQRRDENEKKMLLVMVMKRAKR